MLGIGYPPPPQCSASTVAKQPGTQAVEVGGNQVSLSVALQLLR